VWEERKEKIWIVVLCDGLGWAGILRRGGTLKQKDC